MVSNKPKQERTTGSTSTARLSPLWSTWR